MSARAPALRLPGLPLVLLGVITPYDLQKMLGKLLRLAHERLRNSHLRSRGYIVVELDAIHPVRGKASKFTRSIPTQMRWIELKQSVPES